MWRKVREKIRTLLWWKIRKAKGWKYDPKPLAMLIVLSIFHHGVGYRRLGNLCKMPLYYAAQLQWICICFCRICRLFGPSNNRSICPLSGTFKIKAFIVFYVPPSFLAMHLDLGAEKTLDDSSLFQWLNLHKNHTSSEPSEMKF